MEPGVASLSTRTSLVLSVTILLAVTGGPLAATAKDSGPVMAVSGPGFAPTVEVVAANPSPTPTGLTVTSGQVVNIGVTGTWCMGGVPPQAECGTGAGIRAAGPDELPLILDSAKIGALIGRAGSGPWFEIGSGGRATMPSDGALVLLFNDRPCCYEDNSGSVSVNMATTGSIAYVVNFSGNYVTPIITATNFAGTNISVGTNPQRAALSSDGRMLYVTNNGSSSISVIDTSKNAVRATFAVPGSPYAIAAHPSSPRLYVTLPATDSVVVMDRDTGGVQAVIPVGRTPGAIAVVPGSTLVITTNLQSDSVTVIDTLTAAVDSTIPVSYRPFAIAVTPDGASAYVAHPFLDAVTPITVASRTAGPLIPVGRNPQGLALTPDGRTLYAANADSGHLTAIDVATNTAGARIPVGDNPQGIAATPDGGSLYVTSNSAVVPVDLATSQAGTPIAVGNLAVAIAVSPATVAPPRVAANVGVTASAPGDGRVGRPLTYELTAENAGPSTASRVVLLTTLPESMTLTGFTTSQGTCSQPGPATVECAIGSLAARARATVTVQATPTLPDHVANVASVTAAESDPDPSNNVAVVVTEVSPLRYFALGDSYSSGEGVRPFDAGTDVSSGPARNECHRSHGAYPRLFAIAARADLGSAPTDGASPSRFLACSGATVNDVAGRTSQYPGEPAGQYTLLSKDADLITLSVGGNDVGFDAVMSDCVTHPRPCDVRYKDLSRRIHDQLGPLYNAYLRIKQHAPHARVIVVNYPQIFSPDLLQCGGTGHLAIDRTEMKWIRDRTREMNSVISRAAAAAGVEVLDVENAFLGHEICTGESWANGIDIQPRVHTFHPNILGHRQIANLLDAVA